MPRNNRSSALLALSYQDLTKGLGMGVDTSIRLYFSPSDNSRERATAQDGFLGRLFHLTRWFLGLLPRYHAGSR